MNYISTKELTKKWGISKSRILILVRDGRIPGAKKIGNNWVFPENVEKPEDFRSPLNKLKSEAESFRFPLYLYGDYSDADVKNEFSDDEAKLFEAETRFHKGEIREAYAALRALLQTVYHPAVRSGTLYYLCLCCIHQCKTRDFMFYYESMKALLSQDIPYRQELDLLIHDLDTYLSGNEYYTKGFAFDESYHYHESARNYLYLISAYSALLTGMENGKFTSTFPYEIICQQFESNRSDFSTMTMSSYLAAMNHLNGEMEKGKAYLRKALRLVKQNGWIDSEIFIYHYFSELFEPLLKEKEFSSLKIIREHSDLLFNGMEKMFHSLGYNDPLLNLSEKQIAYIKYAIKGLTNSEIAELKGLSISTVSKNFSVLYEITGTSGRKELVERWSRIIHNYVGPEQ